MSKIDNSKPLYIAGPMSYIKSFNVPAFLEAEILMRERGYDVRLPADLDDEKVVAKLMASDGDPDSLASGMTWGECLALDVKLISDVCGGVVVLPGWRKSRGARLETFTNYLHNRSSYYLATLEEVPHEVLFHAWAGKCES